MKKQIIYGLALTLLTACGSASEPLIPPRNAPQSAGGANPGSDANFGRFGSDNKLPDLTTLKPRQSVSLASSDTAQTPYRETFFKNYGVNPFIDSKSDPQSTFGADADTASYSITRAYLNSGKFPPEAAIRPEEFINAFDYNYKDPKTGNFNIYTHMMTSPFDARNHLLRIGIQGKRVKENKPSNITVVVDVSGSMNKENRLGLVQRSLQILFNKLSKEDRVAVVIYGSEARTLLPHTPVIDRATLDSIIVKLRPEGSTNAEAGLLAGYAEASKAYRHGEINRVILMSDGVANVGEKGPEKILERIKAESESGITLTTLGFGMDGFNDTLMEQLANQGNGNYAYIDTVEEAHKSLSMRLKSTLYTLGYDVKIQVDFPTEYVEQYRLIGYENRDIADRDFRNDTVDSGEVGSASAVTALYEVRLTPEGLQKFKAHSPDALATVRMRYKTIDNLAQVKEIEHRATGQIVAKAPTDRLKLSACVAGFAEILRGSVFAREYSLYQLHDNVKELAENSDVQGREVNELLGLIHQARNLKNPTQPQPIAEDDVIQQSENPRQLSDWKAFLLRQLGGG